jgi:hypothetical protein
MVRQSDGDTVRISINNRLVTNRILEIRLALRIPAALDLVRIALLIRCSKQRAVSKLWD